jgi:hypothetical protein
MNVSFGSFGRLAILSSAIVLAGSAQALTIIRNNLGGAAPGNMAGGGNLAAVFNAAADCWQHHILDAHTLTLNFSWGAQGGGTLAAHQLTGQGGVPNRETSGSIVFDNDGSSVWFADPTPMIPNEWTTFTQASQNYGGGAVNHSRIFTGATGAAVGRFDLFMVAFHEIGHSLGLSGANTSFQAEAADGDVDVTNPRPFAGSVLPVWAPNNAHLNIPTALMYPFANPDVRVIASAVDVLANAQISQFTNLNLNPCMVPEPGTMIAIGMGVAAMAMRRRIRK